MLTKCRIRKGEDTALILADNLDDRDRQHHGRQRIEKASLSYSSLEISFFNLPVSTNQGVR